MEVRASDDDIHRYVEGHISQLPIFVTQKTDLKDEIAESITKAVDGM